VTTIVFDKTGTITEGKPRLKRVYCLVSQSSLPFKYLIALIGSAESQSEHPIASALCAFAKEVILIEPIDYCFQYFIINE
jgi:Cu+-exporting ATPase